MIIRQEKQNDYIKIKEVVKNAFEGAEHSDGNEYNLVDKLRLSSKFVKELALVAEENDEIIGHIMFTEVKVGEKTGLALAPLSVLPKQQKKGVGTALMNKAHKLAKEMGYEFSVVLGSKKYYERVGYKPANQYGILAPFDVPSENFMVLFLNENVFKINGVAQYVKEMF